MVTSPVTEQVQHPPSHLADCLAEAVEERHRVDAELQEPGNRLALEQRLGYAGLGVLLGSVGHEPRVEQVRMVLQPFCDGRVLLPRLLDQRCGALPLLAVQGANGVGRCPDDKSGSGESGLTGGEPGVENRPCVGGEIEVHRRQLAMTLTWGSSHSVGRSETWVTLRRHWRRCFI